MTSYEILKGYYRIAEKDFWHEYNRKESRTGASPSNTGWPPIADEIG